MKKIIITCIIFLMIAGATIGVLQWFNIGPFSDIDSVSEQFSNQAQAKIQIFSLDPVVIHFVQDDKVISVIKIELKLKTRGTKNLRKIASLSTKLKDVFLRDLHSFLPRMLDELGRLDKAVISQRLVMLSKKITKKMIVEDVVIKSITDNNPQK